MDQTIVVSTSLILRGAGLMYSAITNPLKQTALNGGKSYKTTSRQPKLWPWYPQPSRPVTTLYQQKWILT